MFQKLSYFILRLKHVIMKLYFLNYLICIEQCYHYYDNLKKILKKTFAKFAFTHMLIIYYKWFINI